MRTLSLSLFLALLVCLQTAKAQPDLNKNSNGGAAQIVDITATDFAYAMPNKIPSGWVTFRMKNIGNEGHLATFEKAADSLTYNEAPAPTGTAIHW